MYVGVSDKPLKRWQDHVKAVKDSRVGRNILEYGIESFSFSCIAVFANRDYAEKAEKQLIADERPTLNGAHNPEARPMHDDLFKHPVQPQPAVNPRRQTTPQIDNKSLKKKLKKNKYFDVLGEEATKIVVCIKKTRKIVNIAKNVGESDMLTLAPLPWWQSLFGIANQYPTKTHRTLVANSMIRIAQQMLAKNQRQGGGGSRRNQAIQIIQHVLAAPVWDAKHKMEVSVEEALKGRMKFVHAFGVRVNDIRGNKNNSRGILLAVEHAPFKELIKGTAWEKINLRDFLIKSDLGIGPLGKTVRFGEHTVRPLLIPERALQETNFSTEI